MVGDTKTIIPTTPGSEDCVDNKQCTYSRLKKKKCAKFADDVEDDAMNSEQQRLLVDKFVLVAYISFVF